MTSARRAEIRARVEAAPIGPWVAERGFPQVVHNGGENILAEFFQDVDEDGTAARFAAAARQDVPDLLDEVDRLATQIEEQAGWSKNTEDNNLLILRLPCGHARLAFAHWPPQIKHLRFCLVCGCEVGVGREVAGVAEVERLRAELAQVLRNYEVLQGRALTLEGERDDARVEAGQLRAERDQARQDAKRVVSVLENAGRDREEQRHRAETAESERDRARDTARRANTVLNEQVDRAVQAEGERDQARADLAEQTARNGELIAEMQRTRAAADEARAKLAERERLSTSPTRDDLTGLETRCALLHAASDTAPVVKDVAWRAFALIRAYRGLAEQTKRVHGELNAALATTDGMLIQRDSIAAAGHRERAHGIEAGAEEIRRIVHRVRRALDGEES
jgi:hypothetical protein